MLKKPRFRILILVICALFLVASETYAISPCLQGPLEPIVIYSLGLYDTEDTVLYSLVLYSRTEAVEKLTIRGNVPAGSTFVEPIWKPDAATFVGESSGVVTWTMPKIDPDQTVGPFTFRVKLANKDVKVKEQVEATLAWSAPQAGSVSGVVLGTLLMPLAVQESITVDAKGTFNPKGAPGYALLKTIDSGILVPEGAVSEPVTLTIKLLKIDDSQIPEAFKDIWWCAMALITADKNVKFTKPISIILANRRTLTPGLDAKGLSRVPGSGKWQVIAGMDSVAVATGGQHVAFKAVNLELGPTGVELAAGINPKERQNAVLSDRNPCSVSNICAPLHRNHSVGVCCST